MSASSLNQIIQQAKSAYEGEEFVEAARLFEQAAREYRSVGDSLNAAEMFNNQSVALLKAGKGPEALDAVKGTDQIFAAAGDRKRQAMALGNIAAALDELQYSEEALKHYRQSEELLKEVGEKELRAYVLERISAIQLRSGKRIESLITMEAAIESKPKPSFKDRILKSLVGIARRLTGTQ